MQRIGTLNRRRIIFCVISIVVCCAIIALDLITKSYFEKLNAENGNNYNQIIIKDFFYFTYTINTGAAFSFLGNVSWGQLCFKILTCLSLVGFVVLFVLFVKKGYRWMPIGMAFIVGGTIGNFYDRLAFNYVRDFIGFIFGGWYFPVFNIADTFLTVGIIMFMVHVFFLDENAIIKKKNEKPKDWFN